jgi:2-polyprenyl-6-methoxyphenol hydroxylase-like FAD-dependent oxidoreductase
MVVEWLGIIGGGLAGAALGAGLARYWFRQRKRETAPAAAGDTGELLARLIEMGDTLQEVSTGSLQQRGGWDRALFEDVLTRVERQTPRFQAALLDYLDCPDQRESRRLAALLAVDRLSAAYTYWTRLFPPRQQQESMFVLSLLHDLSEKVEHAIRLVQDTTAG